MPLRAIARLIQTMLYAKRFFPYYVYNILGGIEEDGTSHRTITQLFIFFYLMARCPRINGHFILQGPALCIPLILWGHMSAKHVAQLV